MVLYWCDNADYSHSCMRRDDAHARVEPCRACDTVLCFPAGRRSGESAPAQPKQTMRDTFLNKPEPHDSCPMFVGAWGVNHVTDCAWVKWNHARLAARRLGALDKPNPSDQTCAVKTPATWVGFSHTEHWLSRQLDLIDTPPKK